MRLKKFYIFTSIIFFIGIIMTTVGFVNGGMRDIVNVNGENRVYKRSTFSKSFNAQEFKNLDIDLSNRDVEIEYGSDFKVTQNGVDTIPAKIKQQGDTLKITDVNKRVHFYGKIGFNLHEASNKIKVTIPHDKKIDFSNIKIDNGSFTVSDDIFNKLNLDLNGSDTNLENLNLNKDSQIKLSNLDATIKNSNLSAGFKADYSSLEFYNTKFSDNSMSLSDTDISMSTSELENMIINNNNDDIEINSTKFKGKNSINQKDGDVDIRGFVDSGIVVNGNNTDIEYMGQSHEEDFKNDEGNDNLVTINSSDGDVSIS